LSRQMKIGLRRFQLAGREKDLIRTSQDESGIETALRPFAIKLMPQISREADLRLPPIASHIGLRFHLRKIRKSLVGHALTFEKRSPPCPIWRQIHLKVAARFWISQKKLAHIISPKSCLEITIFRPWMTHRRSSV